MSLTKRRVSTSCGVTCNGRTTSATQIMMTTSSWEGQIRGVTSPKPTVEKVTMQKYTESNRDRFFPALSRCWIPQALELGRANHWRVSIAYITAVWEIITSLYIPVTDGETFKFTMQKPINNRSLFFVPEFFCTIAMYRL